MRNKMISLRRGAYGNAVERPDASTLTVVIKQIKEKILDMRFLNKHAIRILGHFHYPGSPDLVATESEVRAGLLR